MHYCVVEHILLIWLIQTRFLKLDESSTTRYQCSWWETINHHSFVFFTWILVTSLPSKCVKTLDVRKSTLTANCNAIHAKWYFDNLCSHRPDSRKRHETKVMQGKWKNYFYFTSPRRNSLHLPKFMTVTKLPSCNAVMDNCPLPCLK